MRQLTCTGPGAVEWRDLPEPRLDGRKDALVRPIAVARCEIDPFLISGFLPLRGPFALGHEAVAEIVSLGDEVRGLSVGERVVVSFQVSCGSCPSCAAGRTAVCDEYPTLSDYGMQPLSGVEYGGMLSDIVRVPHAEAMLHPLPLGADPVALASLADNVVDGFRTVAPHLAARPGADVLIVCHGTRSIALYAVQSALALDAGSVTFASDDALALTLAEKLGARPVTTDFARWAKRYPIVVDCGIRPDGLLYSLGSTEKEGICQSASYYAGARHVPMPLGKLYTLGIQFFIGRAHSAALIPKVMPLIESKRLRPGEVTTRIIRWDEAEKDYLAEAIKLIVIRDELLAEHPRAH